MSRNTMLALIVLMLVGLVGLGGAYWAYKKYKEKQNQEYRYAGKLPIEAKPGVSGDTLKKEILADDLLDTVIKEHDLLSVWGMTDAADAKARLRSKFNLKIEEGVTITYQDKDQQLSQKILTTIANSYLAKLRSALGKPAP